MDAQRAGNGLFKLAGERLTYCDMRSMWRREWSSVWGGFGAIATGVWSVRWFATEACSRGMNALEKKLEMSVFGGSGCRRVG